MAINAQVAQDFVPIKEIRDGVVLMKDGSMRMVLMASSQNIALKSAEEQMAIMTAFQNFLNSLDFSIQIFVQSRRYDIRPYMALLEEQEKKQPNELLRVQTREYIKFIRDFTENQSIMTKNFFLVVPYIPNAFDAQKEGFLGNMFKSKKGTAETDFETNKSQLEQRAYAVSQGLARTGIKSTLLGTRELIELYYRIFNPGEHEKPIVPEEVVGGRRV